MAKTGDLVEFRSGVHGIEAPRNVGIYLDRWRRKGTSWVRLLTLEGEKEMKADHLTRRVLRARYEGNAKDTAGMQARLVQLAAQHAQGALAEEVEEDLAAIEREAWERLAPLAEADADRTWSAQDVAVALYTDPSPGQTRQLQAALDRCRRRGVGRFETVGGHGDTWRPWSTTQHARMVAAWEDLSRLRSAMVDVVEDDDGRSFQRVDLDPATKAEHEETWRWVQAAMAQYVAYDGVPDGADAVAGIGGLPAVQAFGMDLHRNLGFLAADWITAAPTTRSSDYIHFLLETGLWSPQDAVEALVRRHVNQEAFFEHTEDAEAEAAADGLPEPRLEDDPGRLDLRHLTCHTIDPPDAKDFDDAVGIEQTPAGPRLWVHIADVSHYVRPDTVLDRHARKRATSVYLPGRVLPMLPHRIADHLCSLRDDGDRFALSVGMDVRGGSVTGATMHRSIIRVTENLSYADALARRDAGDAVFTTLFRMAEAMRTHRRGLALETGEIRVLLEDTSFTATEKRGDDATQMIETFMVAANEAVARRLDQAEVPALYRCHPLPDPSKAERFQHQAETMGLDLAMDLPEKRGTKAAQTTSLLDHLKAGGGKLQLFGGNMGVGGLPGPDEEQADEENGTEAEAGQGFAALSDEEQEAWLAPFRDAVDAIAQMSDRGRADVATLKLLGCMGRAWYTPQNEGHFGLGLTHYLHFTSPIRRYPDLVVHRNLKWLLDGAEGEPPHGGEGSDIGNMADHCTQQERAAESLERRVKTGCLVLAATESESPGRIVGVTPTALWLRRDDGIEARAGARDLPGGPYQVDDWESMLWVDEETARQRFEEWRPEVDAETGESRVVRARLGDRVGMALAGRDVAAGRSDARITHW